MAENKKSFLLYCDLIYTIEKLTDEQAGKLLKHTLKYVNDQNPNPEDILTEIAFEPIKQSLKRDLLKYEGIRIKNKESADKRWAHKNNASASERIQTDTKNADSDSDSDSVSDSVNENKINKDIDFKKPSLENCIEIFKTKTAFNWTENYAVKSANTFYYFYESKNWMVGKNKMKSLNGAIGGWISRDQNPELSTTKSKEQIINEKKAYYKNLGF
jgi:hypothetical protein